MLSIAAALVFAAAPAAPTSWGSARTIQSEPASLTKALTESKSGSTVLVSATAAKVCEKKGCWVTLTEGDKSVRVTMKDYAFFLPADIAGKTLVVEGVLQEKVTPEADRKHYAKDEGKSKDEIAKIKGDQREWSLVASSISVK
jgi:hypothetical protein